MDDVEAHVARPREPDDRVEVRAVVVEERAALVEDRRDLLDALVEEPERRRVRQHQARRTVVDLCAEVVEVEVAAVGRRDLRELEAGHRDARRVRAVGGVGGDDHVPLRLAAVGEGGAHEHQAGQLALRAGGRLQRDRRAAPRPRRGSAGAPTSARARPALPRPPAAGGGRGSPGAPTTRSLTRGLCFIVQLPSG